MVRRGGGRKQCESTKPPGTLHLLEEADLD